jgi:hypothetical protein
MEKDTIYVALDDSKRKLVVAMLRPGATEPEEREIPKDPPHIQRLFGRLQRGGPVQACYEAGLPEARRDVRAVKLGAPSSWSRFWPARSPGHSSGAGGRALSADVPAAEWSRLMREVVKKTMRLEDEPQGRLRWLTPEEANRLPGRLPREPQPRPGRPCRAGPVHWAEAERGPRADVGPGGSGPRCDPPRDDEERSAAAGAAERGR